MSNGETRPTSLDGVIAKVRHLLIDFDGPICSLFAGTPTAPIPARLRKLISDAGIPVSPAIQDTTDWFAILAYARTTDSDLAARIAHELTDIETTAVATAAPTPYAHDMLAACLASGRSASIISNNSDRAVHAYLDRHDLAGHVTYVAARTGNTPTALKPSPHLIEQAATALGSAPDACALIGDQPTDIQAAQAAHARSVGYARTPAQADRLAAAHADTIITSMADLALNLRARPLPNLAVLDQGGGAARRRARRTRAGRAALGGRSRRGTAGRRGSPPVNSRSASTPLGKVRLAAGLRRDLTAVAQASRQDMEAR